MQPLTECGLIPRPHGDSTWTARGRFCAVQVRCACGEKATPHRFKIIVQQQVTPHLVRCAVKIVIGDSPNYWQTSMKSCLWALRRLSVYDSQTISIRQPACPSQTVCVTTVQRSLKALKKTPSNYTNDIICPTERFVHKIFGRIK